MFINVLMDINGVNGAYMFDINGLLAAINGALYPIVFFIQWFFTWVLMETYGVFCGAITLELKYNFC